MTSRSLELAQAISNTTGNGALVFAGGPTLLSPNVNVLYVNTAISNTGTISLNSNISVSGNLTVNGTIDLPALTTVGLYANAAYTQANTADQRAVTSGVYANSAYLHANASYNAANNATDTWVRNAANSASSYANSAFGQANTATTNAATADQRAVTSGSYANSAFSTANNRVLRSGDAMTGALSTTGNVFAQVLYANSEFYAGVATYSATLLPNALGQFTGNSNTYIQVNQQNIDPQGTSDYVLTSDVGNDTSFYVDLGITNSQYNNLYPNNSLGTSVSPLDGYLIVKGSSINQLGGNLIIGTTSTEVPTDIKIIVGGINEQNVIARFTTSGVIVNGTAIFNSNSAIKVPTGNTAQRTAGASGEFRFNQELEQFEGYNGTAWGSIGGGASGSSGNEVFYENDANVTASYTITSGKNAMSAGPIEIQDGVIVTVPDGSVWTIV